MGSNESLNEPRVGPVTMSVLLLWQRAAVCPSTRSEDTHGALDIILLGGESVVLGVDGIVEQYFLLCLGTWGCIVCRCGCTFRITSCLGGRHTPSLLSFNAYKPWSEEGTDEQDEKGTQW